MKTVNAQYFGGGVIDRKYCMTMVKLSARSPQQPMHHLICYVLYVF